MSTTKHTNSINSSKQSLKRDIENSDSDTSPPQKIFKLDNERPTFFHNTEFRLTGSCLCKKVEFEVTGLQSFEKCNSNS